MSNNQVPDITTLVLSIDTEGEEIDIDKLLAYHNALEDMEGEDECPLDD